MGTTLTGTTPQDTYDSLIKVTDNGALSGTAKFLSDGLGNDSALALSTTAVGIGTAAVSAGKLVVKHSGFQYIAEPTDTATYGYLGVGHFTNGAFIGTTAGTDPVSDILRFGTTGTERMRITSTGNVGIGTSAPADALHLASGNMRITNGASFVSANSAIGSIRTFAGSSNQFENAAITFNTENFVNRGEIIFKTAYDSGLVERGRWLANGGLTFNGDTAAANALDDYEEGTFTATAAPSTSGTITLSVNSCTYTKIGRQVTIKGQLVVGSVASPVGTLVTIAGLPFTSINSVAGRGAGSATYFPAVGSGSLPLNYQLQNAAEWNFVLTASTIAAGDEFYITLTYFV